MRTTFPFVTRTRYTHTEGVNDSWKFHLKPGIGKDNTTFPYVIVNEWISASVAQFLQLPVAPFGLFQKSSRRSLMFGAVNFEGDTTTKWVRPQACWDNHPELCTGIIVFDILVANSDRHRGNIKVDDENKPEKVFLFDHDRTLLHIDKGSGIKRLDKLDGRLGISAGSVSNGNRHCLIDVMDTSAHFSLWLNRAYDLPRTFLENVCWRVRGVGAKKRELQEIVEFLLNRKDNLETIILNNRASFPNIADWPLVL